VHHGKGTHTWTQQQFKHSNPQTLYSFIELLHLHKEDKTQTQTHTHTKRERPDRQSERETHTHKTGKAFQRLNQLHATSVNAPFFAIFHIYNLQQSAQINAEYAVYPRRRGLQSLSVTVTHTHP